MDLNKLTCPEFDNQIIQYVIIKVTCMVLFIPIRIISTHAATCDRVVLVFIHPVYCIQVSSKLYQGCIWVAFGLHLGCI